MSAVYQYLTNLFLVRGARLPYVLAAVGCDDLLCAVQEVISHQFGDVTTGDVIRLWRNKMLVHPSFDFDEVDRKLHTKFDLDRHENNGQANERLSAQQCGIAVQLTGLKEFHGLVT